MLVISLESKEYFDEETLEFVETEGSVIKLEHSLHAISKWESKFNKPFLNSNEKSPAEMMYYIYCMSVDQTSDPTVYTQLDDNHIKRIQDYIDSKQSATVITSNMNGNGGRQIITSELIYYWMIVHNIPSEYQYWHLSRLLMLIRICNAKNNPKKESIRSTYDRHVEQNRRFREEQEALNGTINK